MDNFIMKYIVYCQSPALTKFIYGEYASYEEALEVATKQYWHIRSGWYFWPEVN